MENALGIFQSACLELANREKLRGLECARDLVCLFEGTAYA